MPEVLDRCVAALLKEGYPSARAWAICTKKTGWKKKKGGGWTKRGKDGKTKEHKGGK